MDDLISRQAVLDAMSEEPLVWCDDDDYELGMHNQWESDMAAIRAVPPVLIVEEQKIGHWIDISLDYGDYDYKCSRCGSVQWYDSNFCPDCGSYNAGDKDDTVDQD